MDSPRTSPVLEPETQVQHETDWIVTVYDNDKNTYEEVTTILMIATGCTLEEAAIETWEVDHYGQCVVHRAPREKCLYVQQVISTIGIRVEATPDPMYVS